MKYIIIPNTSIAVVTKGPVAIAGSNFILYSTIGIIDATTHAINIEKNIDKLTVKPNCSEVTFTVIAIQLKLDKIGIRLPNKPNKIP